MPIILRFSTLWNLCDMKAGNKEGEGPARGGVREGVWGRGMNKH